MISTLTIPSLYEQIQYQLKDIDTTELSDDVSTTPVTFFLLSKFLDFPT